jgi:hypothetical protein
VNAPDDMTLVIPLRAKDGMTLPDFYDYWLNAHVTMPARFPGISSIWLHVVSFDRQDWPRLPGVSHRPAHCAAVHAARVDRCVTTKYLGAITPVGVRGVAVADVIRRVGAKSQLAPEVSALFQPVSSA